MDIFGYPDIWGFDLLKNRMKLIFWTIQDEDITNKNMF